ncbi:hypothetical protein D7V94_12495 [Parablautia intestinalis]|uniref:Uncharacterized protein n=1 Tax=Parablautia intestinalis TaxID=2320100 RepID=A0A3A9AI05_9FIRM|nr:hypothetical protein D7V94_12495 [Parablautia intestinalis]
MVITMFEQAFTRLWISAFAYDIILMLIIIIKKHCQRSKITPIVQPRVCAGAVNPESQSQI